jgi:hypothetical protein
MIPARGHPSFPRSSGLRGKRGHHRCGETRLLNRPTKKKRKNKTKTLLAHWSFDGPWWHLFWRPSTAREPRAEWSHGGSWCYDIVELFTDSNKRWLVISDLQNLGVIALSLIETRLLQSYDDICSEDIDQTTVWWWYLFWRRYSWNERILTPESTPVGGLAVLG